MCLLCLCGALAPSGYLAFGMRAFKLIKLVIFKDKEKHPSKRDPDKSCVQLGFGEQIPDGECSEGCQYKKEHCAIEIVY